MEACCREGMAPLRRSRLNLDESLEERLDRELALGDEKGREAANENASESAGELVDFPAAVVCALCDDPDFTGCEPEQSPSGLVPTLSWEPHPVPPLTPFWATARSTTRDAATFFEALPDGPIMPALRFAVICELLAVSSFLLVLVALVAILAPDLLVTAATNAPIRALVLRVVVLGVPAFAALAVLAHVAHGLSVDRGAVKQGAQSRKTRAVRFGLYSCGWDLIIGPLGALLVTLKEGTKNLREIRSLGVGLPTRAKMAFLRGTYRLEGERAEGALQTSYVGAALATVIGAVLIFVALGALILI